LSYARVPQLIVTAEFVSSLLTLSTLLMQAIRSSETSVLTRAAWRYNPEYGILHGFRRDNLNCYRALTGWVL
jgi:hypothetical protein